MGQQSPLQRPAYVLDSPLCALLSSNQAPFDEK